MKNRILYVLLFLAAIAWNGCKEEGRIDFIDDSAPAPGQVRDVVVEDRPGGALLRYTLPTDRNLLCVRAEYEINGVIQETKSSYFKDSLELVGFGKPGTYEVKLFSVGKNEKESAPLIVAINPTTAPVQLTSKSFRDTFGGVAIDFENPTEAGLAFVLLADTANLGYMSEIITYYTSKQKGAFTYRGVGGLDTIPQDFGVYIRDRWGNLSDTLYGTVTPWFEEFIPKTTWTEFKLDGDMDPINSSLMMPNMWNGSPGGNAFHGNETTPLPSIFTWNLGIVVELSRFKYWPRDHADDIWKRGHARIFEIYGSLAPNPDGSLDDSWIPLGRFESLKPSGTGPQITSEDTAFAKEGIDFEFGVSDFAPNPFVPVQYLRFRTIATYAYASASNTSVGEISFWGKQSN
jgi:hypothetical protein